MENKIDFSKTAGIYEDYSSAQKSAGATLLNLLRIGNNEDVLDLGCGVGNLTRKIREITRGKVVGIDLSEGMIKESKGKSRGYDITFEIKSAEDMDYKDHFDLIFCNSCFQWFKEPQKVIENCYAALRKEGRMGVQAPAKKVYNPNFIEAIENVKKDPRTRDIFAYFKEPWFFLESSDEYKKLFERSGFKVVFSEIENIKTEATPEEVFNNFSSGAIVGYLSQDFYNAEISGNYIDSFKEIVKEVFVQQANDRGKVELIFNRVFLVAIKE